MLERLEPQRQQVRKKIWYNIIIGIPLRILVIIIGLILLYLSSKLIESNYYFSSTFYYLLACPIILILTSIYNQVTKKNVLLAKEFENYVKQELFASIFKEWNTSIEYAPKQYIDQSTFNLIGDNRHYNTYSGDDYCTGKLEDGRSFRFSEIQQQHITGSDNDVYTIQRSLLVILEDSQLLQDQSATIRISSNALVTPSQPKKMLQKSSKKHVEDILDAEQMISAENKTTVSLGEHFQVENFNKKNIIPLLSGQWQQDLQYLNQILRNDLALLSQDNRCYLWVKHKEPFWELPIKTRLTDAVLRKTLAWNFARCFILVDYLAKLTQKNP
ncbi:MAG: hypothetical protein ACRBFS_08630 [Aureispira sp.]